MAAGRRRFKWRFTRVLWLLAAGRLRCLARRPAHPRLGGTDLSEGPLRTDRRSQQQVGERPGERRERPGALADDVVVRDPPQRPDACLRRVLARSLRRAQLLEEETRERPDQALARIDAGGADAKDLDEGEARERRRAGDARAQRLRGPVD